MLRIPLRCGAVAAALALSAPEAGATAYFYVPSDENPTLQSAVTDAALSAEAENVIYIRESPILVGPTIGLGADFHCGHKLLVRPDPGVPTLRRATIASLGGSLIFDLTGCRCVTFQDLDIVRHITNAFDLIQILSASDIVIERCRIGNDWTTPGAAGFAYVRIQYPNNIVIRNCLFFSGVPGDMDYGIVATNFGDPSNSLYLLNNVVADYQVTGVDITGAALPGPLLVVQNNVVANHPALAAEPVAFTSNVNLNMTVVASHNAMFASVGFGEHVMGAQSISGFPTGTAVRLPRADLAPSFVQFNWVVLPEWDPNADFYRLQPAGPLHTSPPGVTLTTVVDDWEKDPRPGGVPNPHTDRGADQIEAGVATGTGDLHGQAGTLWAAPSRNPARGALGVLVRSEKAGALDFEVFDVAGRLVHRSERRVAAGWQGALEWPGQTRSGLVFYRLRLVANDGTTAETRGRIAHVR